MIKCRTPAEINVNPDKVARINICAVQYFLSGFMVFPMLVSLYVEIVNQMIGIIAGFKLYNTSPDTALKNSVLHPEMEEWLPCRTPVPFRPIQWGAF